MAKIEPKCTFQGTVIAPTLFFSRDGQTPKAVNVESAEEFILDRISVVSIFPGEGPSSEVG